MDDMTIFQKFQSKLIKISKIQKWLNFPYTDNSYWTDNLLKETKKKLWMYIFNQHYMQSYMLNLTYI